VIEQLQGFQCSAGAWEAQVLTGRLELYDPQWLDGLAMSGEAIWGRLRRPTRDAQARPTGAPLTRNAPIALVLRENLPWLIHRSSGAVVPTRGPAQAVLEALQQRGALFFQELVAASDLLTSQAEDALRELAALGLVTCDGFASVRAVVAGRHGRQTRRNGRNGARKEISSGAGRWSLFPGAIAPAEEEETAEAWCWQLLKRYGVVFRDLVAREAAAPPWGDLARVYRRLELRGEVRGGRFVAKVAGEQFASEEAVAQLRQVRDDPAGDEPWVVISAADPLNLAGIITPGQKVPASHTAALVLWQGRWIAARSGGRTEFFEEVPLALHAEMSRALQRGFRSWSSDQPGGNAEARPRAAV
jgi:ATP-dependent Lhr-like helicase